MAMNQTSEKSFVVGPNDKILVTGASGFIGHRVVAALLDLGFQNLRCLICLYNTVGMSSRHAIMQSLPADRLASLSDA